MASIFASKVRYGWRAALCLLARSQAACASASAAKRIACAGSLSAAAPMSAARGGSTPFEFEREIDQPGLVPIGEAEIDVRRDEADLVADPMSHDRGYRVVEDDALLAVQPARRLVDLGGDGMNAEGQDAVEQGAAPRIEHFALPGEDAHQPGDIVVEPGPRRHDQRAVGGSVRDWPCFMRTEDRIELRLRLGEQLLNDFAHDRFAWRLIR